MLDRLAAGEVPRGLAFVVAAWAAVIAASLEPGGPALDDPAAAELQQRLGSAAALRDDPDAAVRRLLGCAVFPDAIAQHAGFRAAVVQQLAVVHALTERTPS
jgi:mannitol-1-phosphate/altronate dehydrogenase